MIIDYTVWHGFVSYLSCPTQKKFDETLILFDDFLMKNMHVLQMLSATSYSLFSFREVL